MTVLIEGNPPVLYFDGDPTGSADCTTALNSALTAIYAAGGGVIFFPPGRFKFNSQISYTIPSGTSSISFVGAGADVSTLYWPNGSGNSGLVIAASSPSHSVHFRDMTITTGQAGGQTGVQINQSYLGGQYEQSDFFRVTFRGDPSVSDSYWGTALLINGLGNVSYDTVLFWGYFVMGGSNSGTGLIIQGIPDEPISSVHNIAKCGFFYVGIGLVYGTYLQGVTVFQCNFETCGTGISVASDGYGAAQLVVNGCQFDTNYHGIDIESNISNLIIIGNDIYVTDEYSGIYINAEGFAGTIQGNTFQSQPGASGTGTGVNVSGEFTYVVLIGNTFFGLKYGILLGSSTANCNVQANKYYISPTTNEVIDSGTDNKVGMVTN